MERRANEPAENLPELVIWFPDEHGEPIAVDPPTTTDERVREVYATIEAVVEHVKETQSTAGYRPGGTGDQPERRGSGAEVITSLLVHPAAAARLAVSGELFTPPLQTMHVDESSLDSAWPNVSYRVLVKTGIWSQTSGTLLLHPTPSSNITVLELLPDKISRWRVRSFVTAGLAAVDDIRSRLLAQPVFT